ncbi:lytic polysaccharide monooxygenase [Cylindrobasidium torrendii FP15055 ss-10]|uniref:AA9 family lytic polysaccharide monooxygenase n=1 Tax=Cylindrobasidium torrendii FP15055 ss-10 TaxID=1314674 RepID=A0A0D7AVT3_9AGAR|nr:lytic polysaccharide monooxygenase [Cylindrobasidium torrendii FP15055 ss-10]
MKYLAGFLVAAHSLTYTSDIWTTLVTGDGTTSKAAVRQPINNSPVTDVESNDVTCNVTPGKATETVEVAAGDFVGFLLDTDLYHQGPGSIYLGQAPSTVAEWDGSGENWFKIAEWGAVFEPEFTFVDYEWSALNTTIPASVPDGEYLLRVEHIALHVAGSPQFYVSCAQISVTGGGSANPEKVSIPGYISSDDPSITLNIWVPVPTEYTVPGPAVFTG